MESPMDNDWKLKSIDEQKKEFIALLTSKISGETQAHAKLVVNEIVDAISDINAVQQEFLNGDHPNRINWLAKQLDGIAKDRHLDKDELYGTVLSALHKNNQVALKSIFKSKAPMDDVDLTVQNLNPKSKAEREAALNGMDALLDSIAIGDLGCVCKSILSAKKEGKSQTDVSSYEQQLVQKALDSDFLSEEETALKVMAAVNAYIELRNDTNFKGIALAQAIQNAIKYVTYLKYLFQKSQNPFATRLRKYLNSASLATAITLIKRVCYDSGTLMLYAGYKINEGQVEDLLKRLLIPLPINVETKDDIVFWGTKIFKILLNRYIDPSVLYVLHEQASQMLPYLEQAAIDAEKDLGDVILTVSGRVKKMDLYKKISAFSKKVVSKVSKMWKGGSESETSEEKQSEKENT